jgi:hypothetical protein
MIETAVVPRIGGAATVCATIINLMLILNDVGASACDVNTSIK